MRVVCFVGMGRGPIRERRKRCGRKQRTSDYLRLVEPTFTLNIAPNVLARFEPGAGNHRGEGVEDVVFGMYNDRVRQP